MTLRPDDGPAPKRRRLNIVPEHETDLCIQTHQPPLGSHETPSEVEEYNYSGVRPANEACFVANPNSSARQDTLSNPEQQPSDCCYGMLCDIPAKLNCGSRPNAKQVPVNFHSPNYLSSTPDSNSITFDISCPASAKTLGELEDVDEIKTQLYCHSKVELCSTGKTRRNEPAELWFLNVIIFGIQSLEEKVGEYLSKRKMYLQDPLGCVSSVPYRNPHVMSLESDETVMSDSFNSVLGNPKIERLESGYDLLAQLMEDDIPWPETKAPDIVKTSLFRHQKQALTFLIRREEGWGMDDGARDIWSRRRDSSGRFSYTNNVSGCSTYEAPPDFRGGLLADDMGLGKTLSMICLIAVNQAHKALSFTELAYVSVNSIPPAPVKTTLLVVPPALIQAWERQFLMHLKPGALKFYIYHGLNKRGTEFLKQYDVVITTYHTIAAIWRKHDGQSGIEDCIFSMTWHRIVLDEAHTIQNAQSQLAQACCALHSMRRWAITGTPIQNKLSNFASIIKFLRIHPYSDQMSFNEDILRPWQNSHGRNAQGFLRFKTLVRAITISRTKAVVQLPPRVDEIHTLDLTQAEREKYEGVMAQSRAILEEATSSENQGDKAANALSLLNNLRMVCNHGLLAQSTLEGKTYRTAPQLRSCLSSGQACGPFNDNELDCAAYCSICGTSLLEDILEEDSVSSGLETRCQTAVSYQMICGRCNSQTSDSRGGSPYTYPDLAESDESSIPAILKVDNDEGFVIESMSTKIKALVSDLCKYITAEKSVVFSLWIRSLDFVELMLKDRQILYTRIDGRMSLPKRKEALHAFQGDDTVRVILVSITCGGAGLDLTSGSRAYLLEPHWNPMVEEQALCRIHRVGQKRHVTTIRYLMRDTFEEQIVHLQQRKMKLAEVSFAQGPLLEADLGSGILQYLKAVLK